MVSLNGARSRTGEASIPGPRRNEVAIGSGSDSGDLDPKRVQSIKTEVNASIVRLKVGYAWGRYAFLGCNQERFDSSFVAAGGLLRVVDVVFRRLALDVHDEVEESVAEAFNRSGRTGTAARVVAAPFVWIGGRGRAVIEWNLAACFEEVAVVHEVGDFCLGVQGQHQREEDEAAVG